ncbi:hypothetical protein [Flavobacterium sp. PL002]|uniref:hypothetical protein n=1 Tax=Flavobacterium sp. PL002 TaxID=1897058 RepID=UPI00178884A0|nr:hypothetical protein [Flavobacterium sp. PL002]MBE0393690.1 hypothetical protein [Flavobacterium sp. PL002]
MKKISKYFNILKQNKKEIIKPVIFLFLTLVLLFSFKYFATNSIKIKLFELFIFQDKKLLIQNLEINDCLSLIIFKFITIILWASFLNIYTKNKYAKLKLIGFSLFIFLISIGLTNLIFPIYENYLSNSFQFSNIIKLELSILSFYSAEVYVWVLLNLLCMPCYFVLTDKLKIKISLNNLISNFAMIYLLTCLISTPGFITTTIFTIIFIVLFFIGVLITNLFKTKNIIVPTNRNTYFLISSIVTILLGFFILNTNLSIIKLLFVFSFLILIQNLYKSVKLNDSEKLLKTNLK